MFESRLPKGFKGKRVRIHFKEDVEPHEILLDKLAQKKEEELGISEKKLEVPIFKIVLEGFLIFSFFLIFILFARVLQFQIIEGKTLSELSRENKYTLFQIQAQRGVIYDRNLKQLVFNRPSFDLVCEKNNLPQTDSERKMVFKEVAAILKKDSKDLEQKINESQLSEFPILENLSHQELIILETKIEKLPGFKILNKTARQYEDGESFAHLLGYTGKIKAEELKEEKDFYSIEDYIGREGLEKSYEKVLRKTPGKILIERDAYGKIISKKITSLPESGKSLVLNLDSDLQKKIKEELEKQLKLTGVKGAAAVAIDPQTGGILALVSIPTFDNNLFSKGDEKELQKLLDPDNPDKPLFNRTIAGQYLIGSTIKPLIASAALEEKIVSAGKSINCQGVISVKNPYWPEVGPEYYEYHDWKIHGLTDLRKAIAESCNVYFYTIGGGYKDFKGLGVERIKEYLQLFGLGSKTGIDLAGEKEGLIPDPEWKEKYFEKPQDKIWRVGDTYHLSIGQGYILTTPLQVATAFSAVANGGKLLQPQIVKAVVDSDKNIIEEFQPKIIRENFIDPKNLKIVREGMRQAVTAGSATGWLDQLSVAAAAKTGTAQIGGDYYHYWVTVFAPYENPKIVLTIVIENVKGLQSGVILPVAKEVLDWYFKNI